MTPSKSDILLNTPADVQRVRDRLVKEQEGIDPITKEPLNRGCLDHLHNDSQLVRGVIGREINVLVGKIENTYNRNIRYWCKIDLPTLLRGIADYLEQEPLEIVHPGWQKKVQTAFNKLSAKEQDRVLKSFGYSVVDKPNQVKRKANLKKLITSRSVTYGELLEEMKDD